MKRRRLPSTGRRIALLIVLWLVLIVLFFVIFSLSAGFSEILGMTRNSLLVGVPAVVLVLAVVLLFWSMRKLQALVKENTEAVALIRSGRLDDAEKVVESLIERSGRYPTFRVLFMYNAAVIRFRRGQIADSVEEVVEMIRAGWFEKKALGAVEPVVYSMVVHGQALLGDLPLARQWLGTAEERTPSASRGGLVVPEVVILLREGRAEEALEVTEQRWTEAEGTADAHALRVLRLLQAFARRTLDPDGAPSPERILENIRPYQPREFAYLATSWPELRVFFIDLGLVTK